MESDDQKKISQALKVATLYYREGYNQQDIATELNISRATVSRLLQFGRDQGLVTIKINNPLAPSISCAPSYWKSTRPLKRSSSFRARITP